MKWRHEWFGNLPNIPNEQAMSALLEQVEKDAKPHKPAMSEFCLYVLYQAIPKLSSSRNQHGSITLESIIKYCEVYKPPMDKQIFIDLVLHADAQERILRIKKDG